MPQVDMLLCLVYAAVLVCAYGQDPASKVVSDRFAVYWNRTNPK
ncbi:Ephrin-A5 [Liparis tanakae]|uniref:Ephrin-A5 n=1 Tax=Liparis tanakae TaxID=230148 RepID=A0A4Z2E513_9TELE|nr:Ephrin-A5 [Liparis tanakae]